MTNIHICRGTNVRYVGQVRWRGYKLYRNAGHERKTFRLAAMDMFREFLKGDYKRGRVIMTADYYDPVTVLEMSR